MNSQFEDHLMQRPGNDDAFESKGKRCGDKEVRADLNPSFPRDGQGQDDGLHRERFKNRENAILVNQRKADNKHQTSKEMGDIIGVCHPSTSWVRKDNRMARKAKMNAILRKSLTRNTRIFAMLTSHTPRAIAPPAIFIRKKARPASQAGTPAPAGAIPKGTKRQAISDMYARSRNWPAASIRARCRPEYSSTMA